MLVREARSRTWGYSSRRPSIHFFIHCRYSAARSAFVVYKQAVIVAIKSAIEWSSALSLKDESGGWAPFSSPQAMMRASACMGRRWDIKVVVKVSSRHAPAMVQQPEPATFRADAMPDED